MFFFITPICLGWLIGTTLQLQQAQLWSALIYQSMCVSALVVLVVLARNTTHAVWMESHPSPSARQHVQASTLAWLALSASVAHGGAHSHAAAHRRQRAFSL